MERKRIVVCNWKMNGSRQTVSRLLGEAVPRLAGFSAAEIVICVPFPYLETAERVLAGSGIACGAQTLSEHASGAHTGEVSASMLKDFGCGFVIVGHSERRGDQGESDPLVAAKTAAALASGLTPVVCVGETLAEREAGQAEAVVQRQLDAVLAVIEPADRRRWLAAYEPVWAIGTGRTASPEQASRMHAHIRACIARTDPAAADVVRILYGGSVKPASASGLLAMPDIDGVLIGGASLILADFLAIVEAAGAAAAAGRPAP